MKFRTPIVFAVCTLVALVQLGCSQATGSLILSPVGGKKSFSQRFTQSYASRNDDGSYDFVLIADDAEQSARKAKPGKALKPTQDFPLRQLVHIRVPWLPMRGNIAETTVSNASLNWYIFSLAPDHVQDLLLYSGAGFALAREKGDKVTLKLKDATLRPQVARGALNDPLGPFNLSGSIRTINDPGTVKDVLTRTRTQLGLGNP
ncbi:MAG TPA: hypothetical protein VF669_09510 [Tepidisphaeraceae bacterium]|jgi:hypothetical protein